MRRFGVSAVIGAYLYIHDRAGRVPTRMPFGYPFRLPLSERGKDQPTIKRVFDFRRKRS